MPRSEIIAEGITLHLGDCREVLPTLDRVDAIVTDPPYRLTSGGDTGRSCYGGWLASYGNGGEPVRCDIEWSDIMPLLFAALKDDADAYVMANDKNVHAALNAAAAAGFGFHNLLVWEKDTAVPNRWYMKNCEFVLYLWKGKARAIRDPSSRQLAFVPNTRDSAHPTAKPAGLMAHYIENSTDAGQIICDPFMGVGSTGVGCAMRGRGFVGVESESQYFDIACRRIAAAYQQRDFFVEGRMEKPKQEALF